jgi:protein-disulfide isomerase
MSLKSRKCLIAAALLSVAALALCILMSVHSLRGGTLAGCGAGAPCDDLMTGRWSRLFGIFPVSGLAAGVYLAFLFCLGCLFLSGDDGIRRTAALALRVLAGAILGSAAWFIGLQIFAEGAFCKYCMSAHGLGIVISTLTLCGLPSSGKRGVPSFCTGIGAALLLAVIQLSTPAETVYQAGVNEEPLPLIGTATHPVVGNPDAEYVVDLLFDYQCSHCQRIHGLLDEVVGSFGGRVAFVLCPCPLSPKCNPYVPRDEIRFEGSCDLARLALAVHSVDSEAFRIFDAWLFEESGSSGWYPKGVADARMYAASLVGEDRLEDALASSAVDLAIARAADLFGRTSSQGNGGIPRFVTAGRWLVPEASDASSLVSLISSELGIR